MEEEMKLVWSTDLTSVTPIRLCVINDQFHSQAAGIGQQSSSVLGEYHVILIMGPFHEEFLS